MFALKGIPLSFWFPFESQIKNKETKALNAAECASVIDLAWNSMFATDLIRCTTCERERISFRWLAKCVLQLQLQLHLTALQSSTLIFVNWIELSRAKNTFSLFSQFHCKICIVHFECNSFQVFHCLRPTIYMMVFKPSQTYKQTVKSILAFLWFFGVSKCCFTANPLQLHIILQMREFFVHKMFTAWVCVFLSVSFNRP